MTSLSDVRASFLDFFRDRQHSVVPSSPLVPRNDPTLMFTNAGMVQFKNVFTGAEKRPYKRATSVQKCVRAGGKHNDLDNVGYTARHLTFFEMLGNFSFGDYFKEGAIRDAWELVTKDFGLPKDRLVVTVYSQDEEAAALWKKIAGLPDERIIRIPTSANFWSMGETGPCGPCSEIFYDHGPHVPGGPPGSPDEDGDRFVEVWNLVFMQFDQIDAETRVPLPRPSIDTGMGLERFTTVTQGVHNVFDIDLFRHLIAASVDLSGAKSEGEAVFSHRIIADHLRSTSFLIADGVLPSNEGRGYVLRRIMRRAMRHAHLIGSKDPLMHRLVPSLVAEMGGAYPELKRAENLIGETLKLEEIRFRDTLARGLKLLDEASSGLRKGDHLAGEVAFKLYDTYGFPLDLTQDALKAKGIGVDTDGFDAAMQRQKAEARKAWAGSGEAAADTQWFAVRDEFGSTEFLGYDTEEAEGKILAMFKGGERVSTAADGETVLLLTNQTPFYAESGGQVGDRGTIAGPKGEGVVEDTEKKLGSLHVHVVKVTKGAFKVGDAVDLKVDGERRCATRANHSATHLLHAALKRVLGEHVQQKGSLVAPDRLRFDFSHPKPVMAAELERIEQIVNDVIRQNSDVSTRLMATDQAVAEGAEALFGEKYGDEVRVLTMGNDADKPYSVELCGGTHVHRLGDIGLFTILSESAVAAGVRRIDALTSEGARRYLSAQAEIAREAAAVLKTSAAELPARVAQLSDERRKLERELADAKKALALVGPARSGDGDGAKQIAGIKAILRLVEGVNAKDLKGLADDAKAKIGSGVVAFVAVADGKASLVVGVTGDLTARISAVDLVKLGAEALGGKGGGGRADMAQAGGPDGDRAPDALAAIEKRLGALSPARLMPRSGESLRRRAYLALEGGRLGGPIGAAVEVVLVALIVLNVVAYTLQSLPQFERDYRTYLEIFEYVSIAVFTVEYALRLWTAPEDPAAGERGAVLGRLYFASRPLMVIDFIAVAPAFAALFVPFVDLRVLRLIRLLRLLKIARYSPALSALSRVISEERRALYGCLLLFLCAMLLFAAAMHAVEGGVQPRVFGTIPESMWWAVSTLTTVGYGDAVPHTPLGRALAGVAMIVGLGLAALPVGIIATSFANSIHRRDFVVTFGMLARVPLFQGFDARTVSEIMDLLRAYTVGAGDIIATPGERAAAMYFVVAGEVEARMPGRKLRFGAGDFFGELALLQHRTRDATIMAVEASRLLELSAADFEALVRKRPGLKEKIEQLALAPAENAWLLPEEIAEAGGARGRPHAPD